MREIIIGILTGGACIIATENLSEAFGLLVILIVINMLNPR